MDLPMALALAAERGQAMLDIQALHDFKIKELEKQRTVLGELKAIYQLGVQKDIEYVEVEDSASGSIVNMDELYRFVKGIVVEMLEERRA